MPRQTNLNKCLVMFVTYIGWIFSENEKLSMISQTFPQNFVSFFFILYNLYRKVMRFSFSEVRSKMISDEYSSKFEWLSIKAAWWKAFFLGNVTHFKNLAIQRLDAVYNLPNMGQQEGFIFKLYDNCMHIWANLGL